jgi:predicted Zn finger-like uncharacterized protein
MRLACPSCGATYEVPDERLRPGVRRLRCACCAYEWVIEPPAPPSFPPAPPPLVAEAPLAAEPSAPRAPAFPPYEEEAPGRGWGALAAWAASILILVGLGFAAVHFRTDIMQAWPPSVRAYALLGMAPH